MGSNGFLVAPALRRPLLLYAAGHAALLLGAWAMAASESMWPMAFAASTCLMLTAPLVRQLLVGTGSRSQGR